MLQSEHAWLYHKDIWKGIRVGIAGVCQNQMEGVENCENVAVAVQNKLEIVDRATAINLLISKFDTSLMDVLVKFLDFKFTSTLILK